MKRENPTRFNSAPGIFWAAVSVLCWGTLFPAAGILLHRGNVDCYSMGQIRFLIAGCAISGVLWLQQRKAPWRGIGIREWCHLIWQSIFAAAMSVFLFYGQSLGIPVVNAAMLEAEAPLMIFLLGLIVLRAPTNLLQIIGLCAGFLGSLLVLKAISAEGLMITSVTAGDWMIVCGAFCWALYTVLANRTIRKLGGLRYTGWSVFFAGIWILLFQIAAGKPVSLPREMTDLLCLLYLGLVPTALAFFSWNNAQRYISTGLLAISGYFTPMLTALFGWLLFAEPVTPIQGIGMLLVVAAGMIEPEIAAWLRSLFSKKDL